MRGIADLYGTNSWKYCVLWYMVEGTTLLLSVRKARHINGRVLFLDTYMHEIDRIWRISRGKRKAGGIKIREEGAAAL